MSKGLRQIEGVEEVWWCKEHSSGSVHGDSGFCKTTKILVVPVREETE